MATILEIFLAVVHHKKVARLLNYTGKGAFTPYIFSI